MWKCSACQNENKDQYRFCLNCGNPRPSADGSDPAPDGDEEEGGKRSGLITTVLLLLLALIIVLAIATAILVIPRLRSAANDRRQAEIAQAETRRERSTEDDDGTSTFVFGSDSSTAPTNSPEAPQATASSDPSAAASPAVTQDAVSAGNDEYLIPDSSSRYISEADLKNLTHEQCCLARNEIFARHGRIFNTPQIAAYFEGKSWYHGTLTAEQFDDSVFNVYERANINYIFQYENSHWGGSYY